MLNPISTGSPILIPTMKCSIAMDWSVVVRIARLLHLRLSESLPWLQLRGIAVRAGIAALPVLWLTRETTLSPFVGLVTGGVVYGAIYFAFSYGSNITARFLAPARGPET